MNNYLKQVGLLVKLLPYIAREECFALKGGTAINLFYRDFPRISVDIDLTYIYFNDRNTAYKEINEALERIKDKLNSVGFNTVFKESSKEEKKLFCFYEDVYVKIEPNYTMRGYSTKPINMSVTEKVEEILNTSASMNVVSLGEVFGGKICAALNRQHPRDLFDIKHLLENEGFNEEIKKGFIIALLSDKRPIHETLRPNLKEDQKEIFEKEFEGMTEQSFTFTDHKETFDKLVDAIHKSLTEQDKKFLMDFVKLEHKWEDINIPNIEKLPAISWKILNLKTLQQTDEKKFIQQHDLLEESLKPVLLQNKSLNVKKWW